MNTLDMTGLKIFACGVVAVAVTLVGSYGFIASTAVVRTAAAPAALVASATGSHLAQAAATGLLQ
jgi:uncharacterized membrane protein YqiK